MSIYTRKGDKGFTHRADGEKISKDDPLCRALGGLDELNSQLGFCTALMKSCTNESGRPQTGEHIKTLKSMQRQLFEVGVLLNPMASGGSAERKKILSEATKELECQIDRMTQESPLGEHFILPGGSPPAAALNVVRAVCRRAERSIVALRDAGMDVAAEVLEFINRLGDFLFVLAHVINNETGHDEAHWHG